MNIHWKNVIDQYGKYNELHKIIHKERDKFDETELAVLPPQDQIFRCFNYFAPKDTKVVLLGQDPYHGVRQAHGLAFSVPPGVPVPPSLQNIFTEIESSTKTPMSTTHGNLEKWTDQGVFLLNTVLTVRANVPGSHRNRGWEQFTDATIRKLSEKREGIIFLLLGKSAQEKIDIIDVKRHHILCAAHPSPYSASHGFFSCGHFPYINSLLKMSGQTQIDWSIQL